MEDRVFAGPGGCKRYLRKIGTKPSMPDRADRGPILTTIRAELGQVSFDKAWAEGERMTVEQAISYASEELDIFVGDTLTYVFPTDADLTLVAVTVPISEFASFKSEP